MLTLAIFLVSAAASAALSLYAARQRAKATAKLSEQADDLAARLAALATPKDPRTLTPDQLPDVRYLIFTGKHISDHVAEGQ